MIVRPLDTRSLRRRLFWRLGPGVLLTLCLLSGIAGGLIGVRLGLGGSGGAAPIVPSLGGSLAEAARRAHDASVVVQAGTEQTGAGSGVIVGQDGLILTARHVANLSGSLTVILPGETTPRPVERLGIDALTDLALLRLAEPPKEPLATLELGDSDRLGLGSALALAGNPLGAYPGTVAVGILAGRGRDATIAEDGALLSGLLQLDAAVMRGMSGGPLVDADGRLVGVIVAVSDPGQGRPFGFAVPVELARPLVEAARAGEEIARCGLPYQVRPLEPDEAAGLGMGEGPVMVISDPANEGVVLPGDIITSIGGTPLSSEISYALALGRCRAGGPLELEVLRSGGRQPVSVNPIGQQLSK